MKHPVPPHLVTCLILGLILPVPAQNLASSHHPSINSYKSKAVSDNIQRCNSKPAPESHAVPDMKKDRAAVSGKPTVITDQDAAGLKQRPIRIRPADYPLLEILRKPSPESRMASKNKPPQRYEVATNSLQNGLARISAMYREAGKTTQTKIAHR